MKIISDYESVDSVNPLYLTFDQVDGYSEENNGNKYFIFDSTDKNKDVLEKYTKLWDGIKYQIKTINGGKEGEYGKYFMKIRFKSDNLPLNKTLKLHTLTITVRYVIEQDGRYYPQVFLDE